MKLLSSFSGQDISKVEVGLVGDRESQRQPEEERKFFLVRDKCLW